MTARPARETIAFAVALAAIAVLGGAAVAVAAGAPGSGPSVDVDAPPNATLDDDGDRIVVEQAAGQTIAGTTSLDAGAQVTVRVRSAGENPFLRQHVATVDDDGRFAATFDFAAIERGSSFTVSVRYDGSELASADGVIGECTPNCGGDDAPEFGGHVYQAPAGATMDVDVRLAENGTATVLVGSENGNVRIPVTVTDGNSDGTVTLFVETRVDAASDPGVSVVADADSMRVHDTVERPRTFDPAEYNLTLYDGETVSGDEPSDIAVLALVDSTSQSLTTRGGDGAGTTTVGTIYGSATTMAPTGSGTVSLESLGVLAVGGVLAVIGIVALVGGLN